jgi:hypothetical protein
MKGWSPSSPRSASSFPDCSIRSSWRASTRPGPVLAACHALGDWLEQKTPRHPERSVAEQQVDGRKPVVGVPGPRRRYLSAASMLAGCAALNYRAADDGSGTAPARYAQRATLILIHSQIRQYGHIWVFRIPF